MRDIFGKSAENAEFQVRCDVHSTPFSPRSNGNYTYGSSSAFESFYLGTVNGKLDENGHGDFTCPYPDRLKGLPGMATVVSCCRCHGKWFRAQYQTNLHYQSTSN